MGVVRNEFQKSQFNFTYDNPEDFAVWSVSVNLSIIVNVICLIWFPFFCIASHSSGKLTGQKYQAILSRIVSLLLRFF